MKCGAIFGGEQGYADVCGKLVGYGTSDEKLVCGECKGKLLLKMAKHIDLDIFDREERDFVTRLLAKNKEN